MQRDARLEVLEHWTRQTLSRRRDELASRCIGAVELAEAMRTRVIAEVPSPRQRVSRARARLGDPDTLAWIIDNVTPLLDIQEPRTEGEKRDLEEAVLVVFAAAVLPVDVRG